MALERLDHVFLVVEELEAARHSGWISPSRRPPAVQAKKIHGACRFAGIPFDVPMKPGNGPGKPTGARPCDS